MATALASPSKGQTRYGKAPSIKSKPNMRETGGDEERSSTPKEESTRNSPRPESGTGGAQPKGSVTSGTDGIETHSDEDAAGGMHERHAREMKEMHDRHQTEHLAHHEHHHEALKAMHERHREDHKKMSKRHHEEHKAMMSEDEAQAATAAGSMGTTAGQ